MRLLEKLLNDEVRSRARTSSTQARVFSDEVQAVLHRYELKQRTSAEVVALSKSPRDARRLHEQLGLSRELPRTRGRRRRREGRLSACEDRA